MTLVDASHDLDALLHTGGELVVLERRRLGDHPAEDLASATQAPDAPSIIILDDDIEPLEHTNLLAAGAAGVLPCDADEEVLGDAIRELGLEEAAPPRSSLRARRQHPSAQPSFAELLSRSHKMREFMDVVRRVTDSRASLLITGETGVGKEHLARAIHEESRLQTGAFVSVSCAALPENLLEGELFGHTAGAFTGALKARQGRFVEAAKGTLFLDEIGELPLHLQAKLLAVLQSREVRPLGSDRVVHVDCRIMAATNRDLQREVREGRFREDLWYRLNVVPLEVPPLRERAEDIPEIVGRALRRLAEEHARPHVRSVTQRAHEALMAHDWPGNVRELLNVVERAVLLARSSAIRLRELPPSMSHDGDRTSSRAPVPEGAWSEEWLGLPLAEARRTLVRHFERAYLHRLLGRTKGRIGETASRAGIVPRSLYTKMRAHGLRKEDYR
ncbi:MAG: sigma-54 interaction domain-containing protein [Planctomycetota bacterium]